MPMASRIADATRVALVSPLLSAFLLATGCAGNTPRPAATPSTSAPVSATTPANDAAALFARFKAATGGAAWDSVSTLQSEGTVATGGLSGPITSVEDARTGKLVQHFTLGPIVGASGFDGTHPWEQDPGGEITAFDAPESMETARTDAWMTARGFFKPDFDQAQMSAPREELEGTVRYLVVDATPKGGRTISLSFDPQTSLLVRTKIRRDAKVETTLLSDYRQSGPFLLPFHSVQDHTDSSGRTDAREHVDVAFTRITPDARVDDATFAMPPMDAAARIDDPSGVTHVPFELVNNHIYASGSIDGKPVRFLVDTGGANILMPSAAGRLGLTSAGKLAASGVGDEQVDLALAHAKEVRLGGAVLAHPVFYVLDLGDWRSLEGVDADGLVGFEMFRRFRVTVDYAARVLTLTDPAKFTPPAGAHVVPFDLAERIPVVTGTLDGLPARISVDTGSRSSLTLHAPFSRDHDLAKRYGAAPETVTGWGVGGPSHGRPARLGSLVLGDVTIKDIAGDLFTGNKGSFASPDLAANLGGGVLKRFSVTFDYDARKMYLVPNADFAKPDSFDRSGAWLLGDGDGLKVVAVSPGGPAEKAGVAVGDRITTLGGAPAASKTVGEWRTLLRERPAGTHVALQLAAGRKVDLVLADQIPAHAIAKP